MTSLAKYFAVASMCLIIFALPVTVMADPNDYCPVGNLRVPCERTDAGGPAGAQTFGDLVTNVINILLLVAGSISVIFFMLGGFRYVMARGNEEQAEQAKKTMTHAVVGLIAVIMSFAAIYIITTVLISGQDGIGNIVQ